MTPFIPQHRAHYGIGVVRTTVSQLPTKLVQTVRGNATWRPLIPIVLVLQMKNNRQPWSIGKV